MNYNKYEEMSEDELYDKFNKMLEGSVNEPIDAGNVMQSKLLRALTQKELIHIFFNDIIGLPRVSLSFIQYMVNNGIDPRSGQYDEKDDGFINICGCGSIEKINYFIDNFGSDINAQKGKPLLYLIKNNHYDAFKLLVEKGCKVENVHLSALFNDSKIQYIETIIRNNYNDIDIAQSFIKFLCKKHSGIFKLFKFFVDYGVDFNNIIAKL